MIELDHSDITSGDIDWLAENIGNFVRKNAATIIALGGKVDIGLVRRGHGFCLKLKRRAK